MVDERQELHGAIRTVADFPEPGIAFKDISPILADARLFEIGTRLLTQAALALADGGPVDAFAGVDSRGFLFASVAARSADRGCLLVRKEGKLPEPTLSRPAAMEYGNVALCLNPTLFEGKRIVILDDVMATGGTAIAAAELARAAGAEVVGAAFFAEIAFLEGCARFTKDTGVPTAAVLSL